MTRGRTTSSSGTVYSSGAAYVCAAVALVLVLAGCTPGSFLELRRNLADASRVGLVTGRVEYQEIDAATVIVFALQDTPAGWRAANYTHLTGLSRYLLRLDKNERYVIGAFADRNGNLRVDAGEPVDWSAAPVTAARGVAVPRVDLTPRDIDPLPAPLAQAAQALPTLEHKPLPFALGEIATLDDPRFAPEAGHVGLWAPFDFVTHVGSGVFFLQPYAADKIPILFISGADGFPRSWQTFIDSLDRERYQPWIYLYASGARLDNAALALNEAIKALQRQYGFERLYVTAHSMGGLVARGFVQKNTHEDGQRYVRLLVTLSTPWEGHRAAQLGVQYAPATIPSWIDMQVDSDYQQAIFARPLAAGVAHYLMFTYPRTDQPVDRADDGTVSVASQLRDEAVREAKLALGFRETHTSVLRSADVVSVYLRMLADAD